VCAHIFTYMRTEITCVCIYLHICALRLRVCAYIYIFLANEHVGFFALLSSGYGPLLGYTCTTLLVDDTGFHTKGTGTATAVCSFMTSAHKWPSLENLLSRPVLSLFGCRPPMIVRFAPEGGRMQRVLSLFVRSCRVKICRQGL